MNKILIFSFNELQAEQWAWKFGFNVNEYQQEFKYCTEQGYMDLPRGTEFVMAGKWKLRYDQKFLDQLSARGFVRLSKQDLLPMDCSPGWS